MTAAKKLMSYKAVLLMALPLFALFSCGDKYDLNDYDVNINNINNGNKDISGTIVFYNSSDYNISILQDNFSGFVLVDKDTFPPAKSFAVKVNPSNNYGIGSTFSVEYWKKIMRNEDTGNGDVWTKKNLDYSDQITHNVETGKEYTIRVPQPSVTNFTESFLKIYNGSDVPFQLRRQGYLCIQAGNGGTSVPVGTFGVYKIDASASYRNLFINTDSNVLPDFTVEQGYIYNFEFDGNNITQTIVEQI